MQPPIGCAEWGAHMYRVSESIRSTHGQDGAVVLDVEQGRIFSLNLLGSKILEFLEHGLDESQIVNLVSCTFSTSPEVVASDVRQFIESLKEHKLIADR